MTQEEIQQRVHPWKMAEEWAKRPVTSFDVQPLQINPFMTAQVKPTNKHPFLANCEVN